MLHQPLPHVNKGDVSVRIFSLLKVIQSSSGRHGVPLPQIYQGDPCTAIKNSSVILSTLPSTLVLVLEKLNGSSLVQASETRMQNRTLTLLLTLP